MKSKHSLRPASPFKWPMSPGSLLNCDVLLHLDANSCARAEAIENGVTIHPGLRLFLSNQTGFVPIVVSLVGNHDCFRFIIVIV